MTPTKAAAAGQSVSTRTPWYTTSCAHTDATTLEMARMNGAKARGVNCRKPRPNMPSGWVGTSARPTRTMRASAMAHRAIRQSHATASPRNSGRATMMYHQPPKPISTCAVSEPAHASS